MSFSRDRSARAALAWASPGVRWRGDMFGGALAWRASRDSFPLAYLGLRGRR